MRSILIAALCLLPGVLRGYVDMEIKWATLSELRSLGIVITAIRENGSIDVRTIAFNVEAVCARERYDFTDLVVRRRIVTSDLPPQIDLDGGLDEARSQRLAGPKGAFILHGSDWKNAYLAFQFVTKGEPEAGTIRRLLIPVAEILIGADRTANQALQTTSITPRLCGKVSASDRQRRGV
jgi:hypothetical protein